VRGDGRDQVDQSITLDICRNQRNHLNCILGGRYTLRLRHRRVIHGCHRDGDDSGRAGQTSVSGAKLKRIGPIIIRRRRVGHPVRGDCAQRSVRGDGRNQIGQRVAFRVERGKRDLLCRILRRGHVLHLRHRRVIDCRHRDGNRRGRARQAGISGREGEAVRTAVVRRRRVGHPVRGDCAQRPVRRDGRDQIGQRVAFRVSRIKRDLLGRIFGSCHALSLRHRRVIGGRHRDRDRGRRARQGGISGREGEAVRTAVVRRRRISHFVRGKETQRAVRGRRCNGVDQRGVLHVGRDQRDHLSRVFRRGHALRLRHRRVIDCRHRDGNRRGRARQTAIRSLECKAVGTIVVRRRRVGYAVRGDRAQRPMRGDSPDQVGQCVAFRVRSNQCDLFGRVLRRRDALRLCNRHCVHLCHCYGNRRRRARQAGVFGREGKTVGAEIIRRRRIGHLV